MEEINWSVPQRDRLIKLTLIAVEHTNQLQKRTEFLLEIAGMEIDTIPGMISNWIHKKTSDHWNRQWSAELVDCIAFQLCAVVWVGDWRPQETIIVIVCPALLIRLTTIL